MTKISPAEKTSRLIVSLLCIVALLVVMPGPAMPSQNMAPTAVDSLGSPSGSGRPKIGLVLGGGGARGAAHIGVLRVLDEMQIPIDYVCGTSMGAIIATLFSLGLTPDEIEEQFLSIDWDSLLSDLPDRHQRTYRRKEDDDAFFLPVELGFSNKVPVTSRGLLAGQKLGFAFPIPEIYTAGYKGFDKLAYPLQLIATDLHTGEMVIIDRGNLVQAVRASMSIPGLFPPVYWEGRELIDGGVVRNLAVDVMRARGVDIIIAVDVGALPEETTQETLGSIVGVLSQTLTIQARANVVGQLADADVAIEVQLKGISFKDFKRVAETIPLGEAGARAHAGDLSQFAVSKDAYAEHLKAHRLPTKKSPVIDRIVADNSTRTHDRVIRRHIHQQEGEILDLAQLETDLADIYDLGVAELVDFVVTETDSQTVLTVAAHPKLYSPHIFRFGISYNGGQKNKSFAAAHLRYTWLEMNGLGGELRNDGQYGRVFGIKSEFYQPLTWSRTPFLSLGGWWRRGNYDWYENLVDLGHFDVTEYTGTAELGCRVYRLGEVRVGIRHNSVKSTAIPTGNQGGFDGITRGFTAKFAWDLLDQPVFPSKGIAGSINFFAARPSLGSDLDYDKLEGNFTGAIPVWNSTLKLSLKGGTDLDSNMPDFESFYAGGLDRISGYQDQQLRGPTYGIARANWYFNIDKSPSLFPASWYLGLGVGAGNAWCDQKSARLDDLRYFCNVSMMLDTYLGPVILAYGRAEDGNDAAYFTIGSRLGIFE